MQISRINVGKPREEKGSEVSPVKNRPFSHRDDKSKLEKGYTRNKNSPALSNNLIKPCQKTHQKLPTPSLPFTPSPIQHPPKTRPTSSKPACKPKAHPLIRSFIIKDHKQQNLEEMLFDCDKHHNNFITMLNQCINKRSLHAGRAGEGRAVEGRAVFCHDRDKAKLLSDSFNNLRVKESLKLASAAHMGLIHSPKGKDATKNNREKLRRSVKLSKNNSMISNQPQSPQKWQQKQKEFYLSDYSHITEYNTNIPSQENEKSLTPANQNQKITEINGGSNLFSSNFSPSKNYTSYLWNYKQRKFKNKGRNQGSPEICGKQQASFSNSQLLNLHSKMNGKHVSNKAIDPNNLYSQSQAQPRTVCHTTLSPTKLENNDVRLEDLQIFTHIRTHTPKKRKISTNMFSPEKVKVQIEKAEPMAGLSQNASVQLVGKLEYEDGEEGNCCYLQTVNY